MPFVFQRLNQRGAELSLFQFGRAVAAAEVGQVDGGLGIEVPVEQADGGFGHVFDDLRAAGGADGGEEFAALAVEDQGRGHGGARAFAGLDAVGDFLPVFLGDEREVGHLVVEHETLNHDVRAER
ncbi:hypothetical protein D3C84_510370 [compost metagenome]